jgi:hypothetical protein
MQHVMVSSAQFQALSTWVSSVNVYCPTGLVCTASELLIRRATGGLDVAAQVDFETKA